MLDFKDFKIEKTKESPFTTIILNFTDDELSEEAIRYVSQKIEEYKIYLEYDCKGEFNIEYKKNALIQLILTYPDRKIPLDKKDLKNYVMRHVMDFTEYYYKISYLDNSYQDDVAEHI